MEKQVLTADLRAELKGEIGALEQAAYEKGKAEGLAQGKTEGFAQGKAEGATAERERIKAVEAQAMPGHEALIAEMKFDGKTTGIGMWEASMNNTHRAVDLIPKDVVIADWHYERADPTAPYFAVKGFKGKDGLQKTWTASRFLIRGFSPLPPTRERTSGFLSRPGGDVL